MNIQIFYVPKFELWLGLVSQSQGIYRGKFFTFEPSVQLVIETLIERDDLPPVPNQGR